MRQSTSRRRMPRVQLFMAKSTLKPGDTFGFLTVVSFPFPKTVDHYTDYYVRVICECDTDKVVDMDTSVVRTNKTCGCRTGKPRPNETEQRLYRIWKGILRRCDPVKGEPRYGLRGIAVCRKWRTFYHFRRWALSPVNKYAEDLSIDRIDFDGNYEPTNCRWADTLTQALNKSSTRWIKTPDGVTRSIRDAAEYFGVTYQHLYNRVNRSAPARKWQRAA